MRGVRPTVRGIRERGPGSGACALPIVRSLTLAVLAIVLLMPAWEGPAWADSEVSFRAEVDARKLGLDDEVQLTITIEGRSIDLKGDITAPQLDNLRIVAGPSVSTQISFVNGSVSQSRSYTFVLQPTQVGTARIGPARATIGDRERVTEPITLEVVQGSIVQRQPRATDPFGALRGQDPFDTVFAASPRPRREPKLFMDASVDRTTLYVGEPLLLTYYLYTQTSVSGLELDQAPKLRGFWAEELEREKNPRGEAVQHEGESFNRFPVLRRLLFPTKAGNLEIPATGFKVGVPQGGGFFDPLPRGSAVVMRTTRPTTVTAKPLPVQPDFSGAVGRLKATATIDRPVLAVGEAATVRFRVEGTGNLKWIDQAPDLRVVGAKVYPPQVKAELKVTPRGFVGSKTWEYVVVPETAGPHEVPAFHFAFFDPQAGRIERTTTSVLPFFVASAAQPPAPGAASPVSSVAVVAGAQAQLRLRADLDAANHDLPDLPPAAIAWVLTLAIVAHGALLGWPLVLRLRRGEVAPRQGASARRALAEIAKARKSGGSKEAAAMGIERALTGLFGELDEPPAEGDGERERAVKEILREARFLRFAPQLGDYSEKLAEVADKASAAIRRWA